MSYNVWKGWTQVDDGFRKGIDSIRASGADVVGLQEATPELAGKIANELGWSHAGKSNGSAQIVSRFEIVEAVAMERLGGARIRVPGNPGTEIIVFNCHLDYRFYGPYAAAKQGASVESVLQEESRSERTAQMKSMIDFMSKAIPGAGDIPVFLTGDFNGPSHLDWTDEAARLHGNVGAVRWPASDLIVAGGMTDSFRSLHPDPVKEPGFTWSTIHKGTEPQDRIDFIYHKGAGIKVIESRVFQTQVEATVGPWGVEEQLTAIRKNTWPSDHAAVLTTYLVGL